MTNHRRVIDQIIRQSAHLTAEQIFLLAKERLPSICVATVYRNLNLMVQRGELKKVAIPKNPDRFDGNTARHDHCVCTRCGKLFDVSVEGVVGALEKAVEGKVLSYELIVHCVCKECLAVG